MARPLVLLLQLPIPPPGPIPIHGNVPLAAGYLKFFARNRGIEATYDVEIVPGSLVNALGDEGLVEAIVRRRPSIVGFTCYLWNIDRSLWIAQRLKQRDPEIRVVLGGPEITADNPWVLEHPAVDYAAIGEGEQTFAELLAGSHRPLAGEGPGVRATNSPRPLAGEGPGVREQPIPGLWSRAHPMLPPVRRPLPRLDEVSSPYLAGILDAADEQMLMLETMRGCRFRCKFCYYPKSYDALYFVSREKVVANLRHAAQRGAREVVLLDPTLNQRRDFADFLGLLAEHNPGRQFTYFGELRAEGITRQTARLLGEANFSEVEVGLQSLDARAQELIDRRVNLKAFERGVRAMLDAGIHVRVDLILGLPGETVDSFRRNLDYLQASKLYTTVQVFNLSVLPGTALRHEAQSLGLRYQPRPPYYVLGTPTLGLEDMYALMEEAQEALGIEFDPFPAPVLEFPEGHDGPIRVATIDLDAPPCELPPAAARAQAFTLWLRAADFDAQRHAAAALVRRLIEDNPHTTLQVVLEPTDRPEQLTDRALEAIQAACYPSTNYLDRFYSLHPNPLLRAKRVIVLVKDHRTGAIDPDWVDLVERYATLARRDADGMSPS
ncbi:MAG: B12-binding domain-containing radical SAM protein [Thermoguttaceae bacterium]|jgi:radical SAM superfamily enzyme YgiQ (UPF0313 family)|nr:B12-binding domain-containing radical SAM protein [Thermoguttaceae bacterium]